MMAATAPKLYLVKFFLRLLSKNIKKCRGEELNPHVLADIPLSGTRLPAKANYVPEGRLELPRLIQAQVPKTCVYANFTTLAIITLKLYQKRKTKKIVYNYRLYTK